MVCAMYLTQIPLLDTGRMLHLSQNTGTITDPEKLPGGLLPRSRLHRCNSKQLCLDICNGEEQVPSGYNSFVLLSSDWEELLPRRACPSPDRYLHCKTATVSKMVLFPLRTLQYSHLIFPGLPLLSLPPISSSAAVWTHYFLQLQLHGDL